VLFAAAANLSRLDIMRIFKESLCSLSDQLYISVGSISANTSEEYSRHSLNEQARFSEIALGTTREAKDWYYKSRYLLEEKTAILRIRLLTVIGILLLTMINDRGNTYEVKEDDIYYNSDILNKLLLNISDNHN